MGGCWTRIGNEGVMMKEQEGLEVLVQIHVEMTFVMILIA